MMRLLIILGLILASAATYAAEGVGGGTGVSGTTFPKGCAFLGTNSRGQPQCVTAPTTPPGLDFTPPAVLNVVDYGAKCDLKSGLDGSMTAGSVIFTSTSSSFVDADVGKTLGIQGAGVSGANIHPTIESVVSSNSVALSIAASTTANTSISNGLSAFPNNSGTSGYQVGDLITLAGGTLTDVGTQTVLEVVTTQATSVTVANGGSGGTDGTYNAQIADTGLGNSDRPVVNITVSGGVMVSVNSIVYGGEYYQVRGLTGLPIGIADNRYAAPTGATFNMTLGPMTARFISNGSYLSVPSNPVAEASSTGGGIGATWTMGWATGGLFYYGTDDQASINATTAAARVISGQQPVESSSSPPNHPGWTIVFPTTSRCLTRGPLDFTNFVNLGTHVVGAEIECVTSGKACIDMLGTRFMQWENVHIHGSQIGQPYVGVQIGRCTTAVTADTNFFSGFEARGYFTFAGMYNLASETSEFPHLYINNESPNAHTYGLVLDGSNIWQVPSDFCTSDVPFNSHQSCGCGYYTSVTIFTHSNYGGAAVWMNQTANVTFENGYMVNQGNLAGVGPIVTIYQNDLSFPDVNLKLDIHGETAPFLTDSIYITTRNGGGSALIDGLQLTGGNSEFASNSLFKLNPIIRAIQVNNLKVEVASWFPDNTNRKLFDDVSKWTTAGSVTLPYIQNWTEPVGFTGTVCIGGTNCVTYVPTAAINRNPDFVVDQINEGTAVTPTLNHAGVIDGWRASLVGGIGADITYQRTITSPPTGYTYSLATSVASAENPTAARLSSIASILEGPNMASALFGTANARYISFDFCAKANNGGTYAAYLQNAAQNRSYVVNYTIDIADVWQCFMNTIPGDTTGTWVTTPNHFGLIYGFTMGAGSNFNTTAGAWQAGNFVNTSSTFNYINTVGATLNIAAVHIAIGTTTWAFHMPYLARPFDQELALAQRWFTKSCQIGLRCTQSATLGTVGAVTFSSPYASAAAPQDVAIMPFQFPVEMFMNNGTTAPTMTFFSTNVASANCYDATIAGDAGVAAAVNTGSKGSSLKCTLTGVAAGDQLQAHYTADAGF